MEACRAASAGVTVEGRQGPAIPAVAECLNQLNGRRHLVDMESDVRMLIGRRGDRAERTLRQGFGFSSEMGVSIEALARQVLRIVVTNACDQGESSRCPIDYPGRYQRR